MMRLTSANKKCCLLIVLCTMVVQYSTLAQPGPEAKVSGNGMEIVCKGKARFIGGKPLLENHSKEVSNVKGKANVYTYVFDKALSVQTTLTQEGDHIQGIRLSVKGKKRDGKTYAGFFFDELPGFSRGMEIWRYKPWNSWTKPIRVASPKELHDWDVQFFYWQYDDGLYGAAIPLTGNGYRTTLGQENGRFGCKAYTYTKDAPTGDIPMMAIGFGDDPYALFEELYQAGLKMMGKSENIREKKAYPEPLEYIGWCTWNSSEVGKHLDEEHLLNGVATFTDNFFPLGWLLIDDGWFDQQSNQLNAFTPNREKFPNGFHSLTSKLKGDYKLKYVGIWHAYNGYWNGINADSKLGKRYHSELFQWTQNERVDVPSKAVSYSFIKPTSDSLKTFYDDWHRYFVKEGFDFVKVDNQLVTERMSVDTYPIDMMAQKMHEALYASVFKNFNGAVINCMDMTNEAFYNFGRSAVARTVEDYFPERDGGVGYKLEKGGPAAHVLMALYNSLYFGQMVYPDFDMFESDNTYGAYHAAARAISGGPVYVTDLPGKQKFDVLWPLIDASGRIIRADRPSQLTRDCLFQLQDGKPLKAFSFAGKSGLLAVFNAADADQVEGTISPSDIRGLKGESFAVHEFYSGETSVMKKDELKKVTLNRMDNAYYNIVPIENGVALMGLVNKYNAPKTILSSDIKNKRIEVHLMDGEITSFVKSANSNEMSVKNIGGTFKALLPAEPASVMVNDQPLSDYSYINGVFTATIHSGVAKETVMVINLK